MGALQIPDMMMMIIIIIMHGVVSQWMLAEREFETAMNHGLRNRGLLWMSVEEKWDECQYMKLDG